MDECDGVARGCLQLYVDDSVLTCVGTDEEIETSFDIVLLWWLAMGIPLAWKKGSITEETEDHRWIGIMYSLTEHGALMRLPPDFLAELAILIEPLCSSHGVVALADLDSIIGKAARVAHVVPHARPFVAGLWGALAAVQRSGLEGRREAPPGFAACRRFCYAASWVRALITANEGSPLVLERLVTAAPPSSTSTSGWSVEFDASIYGGGAILRNSEGIVTEHFAVVWQGDEAPHLPVEVGNSKDQTFWEFATLLLCLIVWGNNFSESLLTVLGDNTGSLQNSLSLRGRGPLLAVARELSWRQAKFGWKFKVGHLPSEYNVVADALSRIADPTEKVGWPRHALGAATAVTPPRLNQIWRAVPS